MFKFNKTRYSVRQIVRWLWTHHHGCRTQALVNMVIGLVLVMTGLMSVELVRRLTDIAVGARPETSESWPVFSQESISSTFSCVC